ncbi:hypothetical protein PLICRDRAFT_41653 [Plicaturopsis crispa FD-325 SS-3]|nr:hypothetical protein PLICRDRAFT_41653 [Plicaturopsis crispa FD-325 SS-3]
MDVDVDVEGGGATYDLGSPTSGMSIPSPLPPQHQPRKSKVEPTVTSSKRRSIPSQKRRQMTYTDSEQDEYEAPTPRASKGLDSEDEFDEPAPKRAKTKNPPKGKNARSTGANARAGARDAKGKSAAKPKEIVMKDERKMARPALISQPSFDDSGTTRHLPKKSPLENLDVVVDSPSASASDLFPTDPDPTPKKAPTPEPAPAAAPKKRKLPTIKKNKPAGGASTGSHTPATAAKVTPGPTPAAGKPPGDDAGKGGAGGKAPPGHAELDLRNPNIYSQIFKAAGGSTPRSGLNNREKAEERRKELNKMRDEARAKRAAEAKQTFDLQGQWDKISRFEERLRQERSSALFPNFLAAKFKDEFERERRRDERRAMAMKGDARG